MCASVVAVCRLITRGSKNDFTRLNSELFFLLLTYFTGFKVAYTAGPIFEKIMKRYPIFSVQIISYQIDQKHK